MAPFHRSSDKTLVPNDGADTIRQLQQEIANLRIELENASRPLHEKLEPTDAKIRDDYQRLSRNIESWIEEDVVEMLERDETYFLQDLYSREAQRELCSVGLSISNKDLRELHRDSRCFLLVISLLVWGYLRNVVFKKPFPIGLPEAQCETIQSAENVMREMIRKESGGMFSHLVNSSAHHSRPSESRKVGIRRTERPDTYRTIQQSSSGEATQYGGRPAKGAIKLDRPVSVEKLLEEMSRKDSDSSSPAASDDELLITTVPAVPSNYPR